MDTLRDTLTMAIISEDFIRRLSLAGKDERLFRDSKLPGFALRVRRKSDGSLSKLFFVYHELPKQDGSRRRRKILIGEHPTFPADKARDEAQAMLRALKQGDDPAAARAAKKAAPLFEVLVEDFESHIAEKKPETRKDYRGRIRRNLLPYFKGKRVADINSNMVRDFFRKKRANPTDANRSLAVLSVMMARAIELKWRTDNPCIGIKRNEERPRDVWLDEMDLPKFVSALADVTGAYGDLIRFLTVTGWRVSEARLLTWDMIDLPRMVARLPDSKTGATRRELSTDAATILDGQKHRIGFAFSNRNGSAPLSYKGLREKLHGLCQKADIAQITPHALRHTAATWAAMSGAQAHELRQAFGWKTLAMTGRYVSAAESLARRGVQRAADAMNVLQRPAAEVIGISK